MALLFIDGFDHYGPTAARLLDGVYAEINGVSFTASNPRTGPRALRVQAGQNNSGARRVLPGGRTVVGLGYGFNLTELPTNSTSLAFAQFLTAENDPVSTLTIMPTGSIQYRDGNRSGAVVATSGPVVRAGSYQHFECEVGVSDSGGSFVEVRINGVTVLSATGLAVPSDPEVPAVISQVYVGGCYGFPKSGAVGINMDIDDLFCRDDEGTQNTGFVGDQKVYTGYPASDGAEQDWTRSVGAQSWPLLDNVPPDDAVEYLQASDPAEEVAVGLSAFSTEIVSISGVYTASRLWKTDAGNAKVTVDMRSEGDVTAQPEHALSTAPSWYGDMFEVNPDTSAPWLIAELNAAELLITRTE